MTPDKPKSLLDEVLAETTSRRMEANSSAPRGNGSVHGTVVTPQMMLEAIVRENIDLGRKSETVVTVSGGSVRVEFQPNSIKLQDTESNIALQIDAQPRSDGIFLNPRLGGQYWDAPEHFLPRERHAIVNRLSSALGTAFKISAWKEGSGFIDKLLDSRNERTTNGVIPATVLRDEIERKLNEVVASKTFIAEVWADMGAQQGASPHDEQTSRAVLAQALKGDIGRIVSARDIGPVTLGDLLATHINEGWVPEGWVSVGMSRTRPSTPQLGSFPDEPRFRL
jgi:hypothetical protein